MASSIGTLTESTQILLIIIHDKNLFSNNGLLPGSRDPIGQNIFTWLQKQVKKKKIWPQVLYSNALNLRLQIKNFQLNGCH